MSKPRKDAFTNQKKRIFLDTLAELCNVTAAAKKAGVSRGYVYKFRKKDAAFYKGWIAAIGQAYEQLELLLLEYAIHGRPAKMWHNGEERVFCERIALTLYRAHRDTALAQRASRMEEAPAETEAEKRDWVANKLLEMGERLGPNPDSFILPPSAMVDATSNGRDT